jgi:pimeloyl-ACP methyl ester carboxylesterase
MRLAIPLVLALAVLTVGLPTAAEATGTRTSTESRPAEAQATRTAQLAAGSTAATARAVEARDVIRWHGCQVGAGDELGKELDRAGAQCGEVAVPLDYRRPQGRTITVAMSRLPATDSARRIGAMVLNDGGPGGPSLGMPVRLRAAMKEVGGRYDLIGMDPRFVGRSTPLDCEWSVGTWLMSAGSSRRSFNGGVAFAADLARRCTTNAGDLLPYVTTRNTARDMDRIRVALGEEKISYLGYSYGSYLGSVYLQMFPGRADRVVLDGPMDPDLFGPQWLRPAGPANEAALRSWAEWAAARDAKYHLGTKAAEVMARVAQIYEVAARRGLKVGDYLLDDRSVPWLLFGVLGNDREPARLMQTDLITTLSRATSGPVEPSMDVARLLDISFSDDMAAASSAQLAITCGDRAAPRAVNTYWQDIRAHRKSEPFFGGLIRNVSPCAFWPNQPQEAPTQVRNAIPALLVAADGDPRTTYPQALNLHRLLSGSRLVTVQNAQAHGMFGEYGNECTDHHVIDYLATGVLPATDQICTA